jgi:TetR/AcrR family transcriptional regulator
MNARLPTEERQADIVAATLRLARDVSPALITTSDIAAAVGVTQGALFKHFPTKDAIWLAAMQWIRARLLAAVEAAANSAPDPLDALRAVFRAHVAFVTDHPGVPRFIFHELQQPADSPVKQEVRAVLQSYQKLLMRLFAAGTQQGRCSASARSRRGAAT